MRRSALMVVPAVVLTGLAAQATQNVTIFERLNLLDARTASGEARVGELRAQIGSADSELDARWQGVDVAARAAQPIRAQVNRALGSWLVAFRAAGREASEGPAACADSARLLEYAAPLALPARLQDVDVIRRADEEAVAYRAILARRSSLAVELARTEASVQTARDGRELVVVDAREGGAQSDLVATDERFVARLKLLPSADPDFDFHRFKGTLQRPLSGEVDHAFGAQAALVRANGWTWKAADREVRATGAGVVVFAEAFEGWGLVVAVDHGGGYRSLYAHLASSQVRPGDRVERGAILGPTGSTGSLDGPRLYFELRKDGRPVDPAPWFVQP